MHRIKKLTAVILSTLTVSSVCVFGGLNASASGTGAGLAEAKEAVERIFE